MEIYKTIPWEHQRREVEEHWMDNARMLVWDMRTGKTKAVIDSAVMAYLSGTLDRLLVVAPNGVHDNWLLDEFPAHCSIPWAGFGWRSSRALTKAYSAEWAEFVRQRDKLQVFAINKEALRMTFAEKWIAPFLTSGRCGLIVDEAHHFGAAGSRISRRLKGVSKYCEWRRALTGTPVDNSPLKFYSICNILGPAQLGYTTVEKFNHRYAVWVIRKTRSRTYPDVDHYQNLEELVAKVEKFSSLVKRQDCHDLPKIVVSDRSFHVTGDQDQMIRDTKAAVHRAELSAGAAIPKIQAITSGLHTTDGNPRKEMLLEMLAESDEKVIVWCHLVAEIQDLMATLGDRAVCVYGDIPPAKRIVARDRFKSDPSVRVFVGQPRAAGEGFNLSSAGYMVWYSHTYDAIECNQASDRAIQMGGKDIPVYRLIAHEGVDRAILKCLADKSDVVRTIEEEWRRINGRQGSGVITARMGEQAGGSNGEAAFPDVGGECFQSRDAGPLFCP